VFIGRLNHLPIRYKLIILMMLCSTAVALILGCAFAVQDFISAKKGMQGDMQLLTGVIGESNTIPLIYDQLESADYKLSALQENNNVELACLYYDYGELFTQYTGKSTQLTCPSAPPPDGVILTNHLLSITQTVMYGGYPAGTIYIYSNLNSIWQDTYTYLGYTFLFVLFAMGLSFALAQFLQQFIAEPIASLALTTKQLCDSDDYSTRVPKHSDDEIGRLVESFNEMLAEIEKRDKALKAYNQNLEQQVDERTREVLLSVQKLNEHLAIKERWIANVSHEIRTPVHAVKQFSNFGINAIKASKRGDKPLHIEDIERFFNRTLMGANRMNTLIETILDFGKLEAGKMDLKPSETNMLELAEETLEELRHRSEEKHITVLIKVSFPREAYDVACDKNRIVQVITNLLGNAIKFSPEHSTITMEILQQEFIAAGTPNNHMVGMQIIDRGIGIPENEERSIFDSFTQSSRTNTGSGGTGLGLSIAQEIVSLHKGHIAAKNNDNDPGSTFIFFVPSTFGGRAVKKEGRARTPLLELQAKRSA
jgi:two-component system sensor histidine kinase/response regulator